MGDDMPTSDFHIITCLFLLLPKHLPLHTGTGCFSPTCYSSSYVLSSSFGFNFVDSFSTPVIMNVRGSLGL